MQTWCTMVTKEGFNNLYKDIREATKDLGDIIYKNDKNGDAKSQNATVGDTSMDFIAQADANLESKIVDQPPRFKHMKQSGVKNVKGFKTKPLRQQTMKKFKPNVAMGDRANNHQKTLGTKKKSFKGVLKCHVCSGPHLMRECQKIKDLIAREGRQRESASTVTDELLNKSGIETINGDDEERELRLGDVSSFIFH